MLLVWDPQLESHCLRANVVTWGSETEFNFHYYFTFFHTGFFVFFLIFYT